MEIFVEKSQKGKAEKYSGLRQKTKNVEYTRSSNDTDA